MAIDRDTVRRVAALARIRVPETDLDTLAGELGNIIGWVEQLAEVKTAGVEPMASVADVALRRREDRVTDGNIRDKILANAPEAHDGSFAVPKVVE
jgi:aspartyl-tRNA(Asn)/glutamyl-tRNA(Gln) amidotransferase subunit C